MYVEIKLDVPEVDIFGPIKGATQKFFCGGT